MPDTRPSIAITAGEPAGVGADIIASLKPNQFDARLVVIGDRELLETRARALGSSIEFIKYTPELDNQMPGIELIHRPLVNECKPGLLDPGNATYVLSLLEHACQGCLQNEFDAMVTAPVQKDIINEAGITFTGHTEFLAELCIAPKPVMLLAADKLRVALLTTHLPLREVADSISRELILQIVGIIDHDLKLRFGLHNPHIKICGLNPHAGEGGYLGREEIDIITPAIRELQFKNLNVSGPYPADTVFTPRCLSDADVVLAMFHDQGLPVLKHVGFHRAINTTLGLPIIRTSVDHGTALDLAGTSGADPGSLVAAIESAIFQANCKRQHASAA